VLFHQFTPVDSCWRTVDTATR